MGTTVSRPWESAVRVLAFLVIFLVAVGTAVAQDDNTTSPESSTNDTANDTVGNETDGGTPGDGVEDGGESPAASDCISEVTLVGVPEAVWETPDGAVNPRLAVCPSATVTFTIEIQGGIPHNFVVQDAPGAPPVTDTLTEGDVATYVWETPESGSFTYICLIHPNTMKGTVSAGQSGGGGGAPAEGGEITGPINAPTTSLQAVAPGATCDYDIPAIVTRDIVGGPTVADYEGKCVQTAGDEEPTAHAADLVLPLSWLLIGVGIVAVVWVHKYYKP